MKRTIIVGDIHSCADELIELLDKVKFKKETSRLIFIGDLLGKGNKPLETFLIYKQTGAICIMGNAELAFLKNYEEPSFLKEYIEPTKSPLLINSSRLLNSSIISLCSPANNRKACKKLLFPELLSPVKKVSGAKWISLSLIDLKF